MGLFESKIQAAMRTDDIAALADCLQLAPDAVTKADYFSGFTLLHSAAKDGSPAIIQCILDTGKADVKARTTKGWWSGLETPLHIAVMNRRHAAISVLAAARADLAAECQNGMTPLALAATNGDIACTEALLRAGADPYGKTRSGMNALDVAVHADVAGAVPLLLAHITRLEPRLHAFEAALHSHNGREAIVRAFLHARAVPPSAVAAYLQSCASQAVTLASQAAVLSNEAVSAELAVEERRKALARHEGDQLHKSVSAQGEGLSKINAEERTTALRSELQQAEARLADVRGKLRTCEGRLARLSGLSRELTRYVAMDAATADGADVPGVTGRRRSQGTLPVRVPTAPPMHEGNETPECGTGKGVGSAAATSAPPTASTSVGTGSEGTGAAGEANACTVCLDAVRDTALVPCGHMLCGACAGSVQASRMPCPLCRATIQRTVKVYM